MTISLRHLLILLASLGLLPLAVSGVWGIYSAAEHQQREDAAHMLSLARALSSAVDAELDGAIAALTSIANAPALTEGNVGAFYAIARGQAQSQDDWLGVSLADARGSILFRTAAPFGTTQAAAADPASLQRLFAGGKPVIGATLREGNGRYAFRVRVPAHDAAGHQYALTAVVAPDRIGRVLQRQGIGANTVMSILDANGIIVARSRNQERAVGLPANPKTRDFLRLAGQESVGPTITMEGDRMTAAFTKRSRYGWTVLVGVPRTALPQAIVNGFTGYGFGIAVSLAACFGLATLLAGRIVRAFNRLQAGTAALGAGAPVAVAPSRVKEIALMGDALAVAAHQRDTFDAERAHLLASLEEAVRLQERALVDAGNASRTKDDFLAVLGHELRNPLSPIVASLDLMDMRQDPANARERAIMRRQVNHLKRLVDDLLDVSRITSGKLKLDMGLVNLAEVVRQVTGAAGGMALRVEAPEASWVEGDESRLVQVLSNLLSNAARFSQGLVTVVLTAHDGRARLSVSDSGIGMPPELLAQVFEPFYQAPQQLARATGGLGLGLAIVRKIVELHGGRVSAHSAGIGHGSRFEVTLPLAVAPHDAARAAPAVPMAPQRILLVDDNEDAAITTAALLEQLGCSVRVAHTAAAAIAAFEQEQPAIAILDIGLPDMDGYGLAALLRARQAGTALRLVALTGYAQAADVQRASAAGFDRHLTKPATVDDLRAALA